MCAALLLAKLGVESVLIERRPSTAIHPKARAINVRTMEILRGLGIDEDVRAAGFQDGSVRFVGADAVSPWREVVRSADAFSEVDALGHSPMSLNAVLCSQDAFEPVLRAAMETQPLIDVRFGYHVTSWRQDESGVTLAVEHRASGVTDSLRAEYMIGADGANSRIRASLNIGLSGDESLQEAVSVLFRSDLLAKRTGTETGFIYLDNPATVGKAIIAPVDSEGRAALLGRPQVMDRLPLDDIDWLAELKSAVGDPEQEFEILDVRTWTVAARVADTYQDGRIFLAGDATHVMPPYGGFNMNTGIQDVHNLAWKIAGVLSGWAEPSILDSYTPERRPVAEFNAAEGLLNFHTHIGSASTGPSEFRTPYFLHPGLDLGFVYPSIGTDDEAEPVTWDAHEYRPDATPGARAPHVWLRGAGSATVSTIDLFGERLVALTNAGSATSENVSTAINGWAVPAAHVTIGEGGDYQDDDGAWARAYGLGEEGVVFVRPDGHVLARYRDGRGADLTAVLRHYRGAPTRADLELPEGGRS
jgi:2-polyprenyl-6-methoxyphenol hydroxylase-like FAD-dependent oxidoreductase